MRSAALALLAWAVLCPLVFAQSGGLQVLPQAVVINFPQGYEVYNDAGELLKTVPGPTSATIRAKTAGKTFAVGEVYLSDWSYDHLQQGKPPNWIVPKSEAAATTVSHAAAPSGASAGLIVYPAITEVLFPEGYNVFSDDGQLIKTVPGPTSIALKGETGGKTFANGTAYLSDWSYDQLQKGKKPNWVTPCIERQEITCLSKITAKNKFSDVYGAQILADAANRHVDEGVAIDPNKRGMSVHGITPIRIRESGSQMAVFPDPVEAVFPLGYKILDDSGNVVSNSLVPTTTLLRAGTASQYTYASDDLLFLSEADYERLKSGASPNWLLVSSAGGLGHFPTILNRTNKVWEPVDSNLPKLEGCSSETWEQIGFYGPPALFDDVIFSHHPLTYRVFKEIGQSRGGKEWDDVFEIDSCSEVPELCGTSGSNILPSVFKEIAFLPKKERDWFLNSFPGLYQAVVDAFRRDLDSSPENSDTSIPERGISSQLPDDDVVYLEFYRSPFVQARSGEWPGYVSWNRLTDDEKKALPKGLPGKHPSFYGLRLYRGGACVENVALFGAVDFEVFVELMLRNYTKRNIGLGLASTDEWLQGFFESIYNRVFSKIRPHLHGIRTIYWKADGYFHLIPLDLIAVTASADDGIRNVPLIEVTDAVAASKLSHADSKLDVSKVLLVANPEFDSGSLPTSIDREHDPETARLVSRAFNNRSLSFTDLPGADAEVTSLSTTLGADGSSEIRVLRKNEATESEVVRNLKECTLAHVATHGFYLDMTLAPSKESEALIKELKNSPNPYFRSGVALVGANSTLANWSKGKILGSSSDGILLASEIREMDLRNVKLLVLSACSTAEGKPVDGKSVASLRDAFLQAGVETLVSTLWDIPDDFSAKLMADFYSLLLAGDSPSLALWKVKKENFLELRKTNGFTESMIKVAPFVAVTQGPK